MSRQARVVSSTDTYHIIMRGNNKSYIFDDKDIKAYYFKCINILEKEKEVEIYAWCIMDNHVHLVLKVLPEKLEVVFKRLNVKYAMYYHKKHKSVGHVFQDRYKSEAIESDESLINVIRYVHNNPVKAKMTDNPSDYQWSSYRRYIEDRSEAMTMAWTLIGNTKKQFESFHKAIDDMIYLDIKEDMEKMKEELAQKAITNVCKKYGITDGKEIFQRDDIFREIVKEIKNKSHLSGRKIAKLVGVSETTVRKMVHDKRI